MKTILDIIKKTTQFVTSKMNYADISTYSFIKNVSVKLGLKAQYVNFI